jgi:hypothetical protein
VPKKLAHSSERRQAHLGSQGICKRSDSSGVRSRGHRVRRSKGHAAQAHGSEGRETPKGPAGTAGVAVRGCMYRDPPRQGNSRSINSRPKKSLKKKKYTKQKTKNTKNKKKTKKIKKSKQ